MTPAEPIGGERNPEDAAITGGAPPAAEPPPLTRGRHASIVAPVLIYGLAGVVLILTALLAGMEGDRAIGTAIVGAILVFLAGLSIAGVVHAPERGGLGVVVAGLLTILAFALPEGGVERGIFLACAAAVLIGGFAALAAARRPHPGDAGEEPSPGVRNV